MAKEDRDEFEELEDESVYGSDSREEMMDGDGISSEEEAFMKGYEEDSNTDEDRELNEAEQEEEDF